MSICKGVFKIFVPRVSNLALSEFVGPAEPVLNLCILLVLLLNVIKADGLA